MNAARIKSAGTHTDDFLVEVPGPGHWRIKPDNRVDFVPRWKVPEILEHAQPEPIAVHADSTWGSIRLVRTWRSVQKVHAACRLCTVCHAFRHPETKQATCVVEVPPKTPADELALFSMRGHEQDSEVKDQRFAMSDIEGGDLLDDDYLVDTSVFAPGEPFDDREMKKRQASRAENLEPAAK